MKFKQFMCVILVISMMFSSLAVSVQASTTQPDLLIGDADRDGKITIIDATTIGQHLAMIKTMDELSVEVAKTDFSSDKLTIIDATIIQMKLADFDDNNTREVGKTAFYYSNGEYRPILEKYQNLLDKQMTKYEVSGVAFATRNGRVMCQASYGIKNPKLITPMSMDTLFPVGSVSKQFCATAIMILQDQGKLSVNDTLDKYFPQYKYASQMTLHELLCMRTGIYDFLNDNPEAENLFNYDNEADNQRAILDWIYSQDLAYTPGKRFAYSNSNYFLLSLIVEQVSGMDYTDFIQTYIFDELSMENTGVIWDLMYDENTALPIDADKVDYGVYPPGIAQGAGEIVSNAEDMNIWLDALGSGTLLSAESHKMMTTDHCDDESYGYGIWVNKGNRYYHGGNIMTFESAVYTDAKNHINVFVVTNDVMTTRGNNAIMTSIAQYIATLLK